MNLVEAVNKALGTDGTNLQGALNEAAGVDASNVTEAISKYEGGGGGGGGYFNTAEVTVTVNEGANGTIDMPIVYDGEYSALVTLVPQRGTSTYTVPLFKGEADISVLSSDVSITTTGSIEYVSADGYIAVTGDGTITIAKTSG